MSMKQSLVQNAASMPENTPPVVVVDVDPHVTQSMAMPTPAYTQGRNHPGRFSSGICSCCDNCNVLWAVACCFYINIGQLCQRYSAVNSDGSKKVKCKLVTAVFLVLYLFYLAFYVNDEPIRHNSYGTPYLSIDSGVLRNASFTLLSSTRTLHAHGHPSVDKRGLTRAALCLRQAQFHSGSSMPFSPHPASLLY